MANRRFSRRQSLRRIACLGPGLVLAGRELFSLQAGLGGAGAVPAQAEGETALSREDDQFLDELEKAEFQFFWEQASPQTGLVKDRCNVRTTDKTVVASIAATGFGLTARSRGACAHHSALSLENAAEPSRLLLSLRGCEHG